MVDFSDDGANGNTVLATPLTPGIAVCITLLIVPVVSASGLFLT